MSGYITHHPQKQTVTKRLKNYIRDPPELALDINPAFTSISPDAAAPPLPPRSMPVAYAHAAPASAVGSLPIATAL